MLNLHRALGFHPALRAKLARGESGKLLVGYDTRNRDIALRAFSALPDSLDATTLCLESTAPADIAVALDNADLFVLLYDSSCLPTPSPSGPPFLAAIRPAIVEHWSNRFYSRITARTSTRRSPNRSTTSPPATAG